MPSPSISVIVTTCDRPALLGDALRSVAAQSLAPFEVRLADDGEVPATDSLPDLALLELTVLHVRCGNAGLARNAAVAGARGDILAFLDDDDLWRPDHLAGLARAFEDPDTLFAWRDCEVIRERIGEGGEREILASAVIARDWDGGLMRTNDYLPPSAWGVRRSLFDELGGFDETFPFSEDWDFVLRAAARAIPRREPGVSVEVRLRESGNASADFGPGRLDCLRRLASRHGLPPLEPRTFWEVAHALGAPR
jgi:glycosyltransferase involved in cell wall biosynthesis